MRTYNQKKSALEKGIQKMGLTRSSSVTWELVQPSKIATEMEGYITRIVKMTGDVVRAQRLFRYYGQDA